MPKDSKIKVVFTTPVSMLAAALKEWHRVSQIAGAQMASLERMLSEMRKEKVVVRPGDLVVSIAEIGSKHCPNRVVVTPSVWWRFNKKADNSKIPDGHVPVVGITNNGNLYCGVGAYNQYQLPDGREVEGYDCG